MMYLFVRFQINLIMNFFYNTVNKLKDKIKITSFFIIFSVTIFISSKEKLEVLIFTPSPVNVYLQCGLFYFLEPLKQEASLCILL